MKQDERVRWQVIERLSGKLLGKPYRFWGHASRFAKRYVAGSIEIIEVTAPGYEWADCPGEAHKNAYIDNCGVCMPRWGRIIVKTKETK